VTSVMVENDKGQIISLIEDDDGGYSAKIKIDDQSFITKEGSRIRLNVLDYSNDLIQSKFQVIERGPSFDNISYKIVNKDIIAIGNVKEEAEFIELNGQLKKSVNNTTNYFYTDFLHHYLINEQIENQAIIRTCYVTEKIKTPINQFNANEINTNGGQNFPLLTLRSDNTYSDDSYMSIIVNTIDEDAYKYREQLANLTSNENNIFSTNKDKIKSNFAVNNKLQIEVFGFFTVATQSVARVKLLAKDFKKIKKDCPSELDEIGGCVRKQCCNCMIVKGASLDKPHFWN
jgi:hypothetical protein